MDAMTLPPPPNEQDALERAFLRRPLIDRAETDKAVRELLCDLSALPLIAQQH